MKSLNRKQSQIARATILQEINPRTTDFSKGYDMALSNDVSKPLIKKFNGSHLALWALGKNLKDRVYYANGIKGGKN